MPTEEHRKDEQGSEGHIVLQQEGHSVTVGPRTKDTVRGKLSLLDDRS